MSHANGLPTPHTNPYLAHHVDNPYLSSGVAERRPPGRAFARASAHDGGGHDNDGAEGDGEGWEHSHTHDARPQWRSDNDLPPQGRFYSQQQTNTAVPPRPSKPPKRDTRFVFGNYDQYYGFRNPGEAGSFAVARLDPRLETVCGLHVDDEAVGEAGDVEEDALEKARKKIDNNWFRGKRVLDVGCNAGGMTVPIALLFRPSHIEGVDIDPSLVFKARRYASYVASVCSPTTTPPSANDEDQDGEMEFDHFPVSCIATYGVIPLVKTPAHRSSTSLSTSTSVTLSALKHDFPSFPHNLTFRATDWAVEPDSRVEPWVDGVDRIDARRVGGRVGKPVTVGEGGAGAGAGGKRKHDEVEGGAYGQGGKEGVDEVEDTYDVILALSLTKWIHLTHGDRGLQRFFRRCYASLNQGGVLVLEPQEWESYGKASKTGEIPARHYREIRLKPHQFRDHLIDEVGFKRCEVLGRGKGSHSKGFERDVMAFFK